MPEQDSVKSNKYQRWVDMAHMFDQWRIFPRVFISMYIYLLYKVVVWYMALQAPSMEQHGLVYIQVLVNLVQAKRNRI